MAFDFTTTFLVATTFVVISLIYLYLHLTRNFNYWKNQNAPYMKPIPLFGNFFPVISLKIMMGNFLENLHRSTTAPFIGFFCFDQPFLLIRDPDLVKHVLIKDFDNFSDRSIADNQRDEKYGSNILFLLKNPRWRKARLKLTPAFSSGKLKNMTYLIVNVSNTMVQYLNDKVATDNEIYSRELSMKFSTDVITSCAFGLDANSFKNENAEFRWASRRLFENTLSRGIQNISYFFAPFLVKTFRMTFLEPKACNFMKNVLEETMLEREKNKTFRSDLFDLLLEIKNNQSKTSADFLDPDLILAQAIQFFVASFETIGSTMFFALHEISFNTSIQQRLRKEIISNIDNHGGLSYDSVQAMPYLDMVISETMRKFPVLSFLDRRCTKDYKIPNTEVIIKKGLPVYVSLLGLHYDPEYFPDPCKFDPERFSSENVNDIPGFVYMPFGKGLHNCIGARFALITMKIGLANLISNFEMEPCEDTLYQIPFNPKAFLLAPPKDIKMRFKKYSQ